MRKQDRQKITLPLKFKAVCTLTGEEGHTFELVARREIRDTHRDTDWVVGSHFVHSAAIKTAPSLHQSTGVFDTNGKEVFLDDIVREFDSSLGLYNLFRVFIRLGAVWMVAHELTTDAPNSLLEVALCVSNTLEVIGNKYTSVPVLQDYLRV